MAHVNRPFPSYLLPLCQNECLCKTINNIKMSFTSPACSFPCKSNPLSFVSMVLHGLVLKMRQRATWKWPIHLKYSTCMIKNVSSEHKVS